MLTVDKIESVLGILLDEFHALIKKKDLDKLSDPLFDVIKLSGLNFLITENNHKLKKMRNTFERLHDMDETYLSSPIRHVNDNLLQIDQYNIYQEEHASLRTEIFETKRILDKYKNMDSLTTQIKNKQQQLLSDKNNNGLSALHLAAKTNELEIVTLFIEYGANMNTQDTHGNTALHFAFEEGYIGISQYLLQISGSNRDNYLNQPNLAGHSAIDKAAIKRRFKFLEKLKIPSTAFVEMEKSKSSLQEAAKLLDQYEEKINNTNTSVAGVNNNNATNVTKDEKSENLIILNPEKHDHIEDTIPELEENKVAAKSSGNADQKSTQSIPSNSDNSQNITPTLEEVKQTEMPSIKSGKEEESDEEGKENSRGNLPMEPQTEENKEREEIPNSNNNANTSYSEPNLLCEIKEYVIKANKQIETAQAKLANVQSEIAAVNKKLEGQKSNQGANQDQINLLSASLEALKEDQRELQEELQPKLDYRRARDEAHDKFSKLGENFINYYGLMIIRLENIFLGAKVVGSGQVDSSTSSALATAIKGANSVAKIGSKLAENAPINLLKIICSIFPPIEKYIETMDAIADFVSRERQNNMLTYVGELANNKTTIKAIELVARKLTEMYANQLNFVGNENQLSTRQRSLPEAILKKLNHGAEKIMQIVLKEKIFTNIDKLIAFALIRMLKAMKNKKVGPNSDLYAGENYKRLADELVECVTNEMSLGEGLIESIYTLLESHTIDTHDGRRWSLSGFYLKSGIMIKEANSTEKKFYEGTIGRHKTNGQYYDYREGSSEDVSRWNLKEVSDPKEKHQQSDNDNSNETQFDSPSSRNNMDSNHHRKETVSSKNKSEFKRLSKAEYEGMLKELKEAKERANKAEQDIKALREEFTELQTLVVSNQASSKNNQSNASGINAEQTNYNPKMFPAAPQKHTSQKLPANQQMEPNF